MIRQYSVALFWHSSIKASEPGLDMRDGNMQAVSHQSRCQSGVCVSVHQNEVRGLFLQNPFQPFNHFRQLSTMAAGTNIQIVFWGHQSKGFEKNSGHFLIIMLSGVNHNLFNSLQRWIGRAIVNRNGLRYRASFNEMGSCANDCRDIQWDWTEILDCPDVGVVHTWATDFSGSSLQELLATSYILPHDLQTITGEGSGSRMPQEQTQPTCLAGTPITRA